MSEIKRYRDFWPHYLREHSRGTTRILHLIGTAVGLVLFGIGLVTADVLLSGAGLAAGYAFAWVGHALVERNRPATMQHPIWSFISDFRMLGYFLLGRLGSELRKHRIVERHKRGGGPD
jgi:hypothetical protein